MQKITPFLWFDGKAVEAAKFYTGIFKNSRIESVARYPKGSHYPAGRVMTVEFTLNGQRFIALNGGPQFKFNEALSFVVNCKTQAEVDYYWKRLTAGGGKEVQCGWLKDKFGLCWQIVPTVIWEAYRGGDPARAQRVFQAMLGMVKLDIAKLKQAYRGDTKGKKTKK